MPWIRLSDDYLGDEKISALSHGGFRLWHEGLAHCRRHQTDGLIPFSIMRQLPTFSKSREKELATPLREDMAPLWELIPKMGYKVHNYLEWNPSKEFEQERRADSRDRMRGWRERERRVTKGTPQTAAVVTPVLQRNEPVTHAFVPGEGEDLTGSSSERESERKPSRTIEERAGALLERYAELYEKHRFGAKLALIPSPKQFQQACELVRRWDDDRLEKLAVLVLTTDMDEYITNSDRGFGMFVLKVSWADNKLAEWLHQRRGVTV